MDDTAARTEMVSRQIAARGITNPRVLETMRSVPRHRFVGAALQSEAYEDRPLPIGEGQTISQPYMVASMTAVLDPRPGDRVLEIGTGSGYQTAVLAQLANHVTSVERHAPLADNARELLRVLGIRNVEIVVADGSHGWLDGAPYDRILVTAGAPAISASLKAQLARDGRLVVPVGPPGLQHITIVDRDGERFVDRTGEACTFVPLIGAGGWPER